MAPHFSLLEVFEQAEHIERNGNQFYTQAADAAQDPQTQAVFRRLAAEELNHQAFFHDLRQQYCQMQDVNWVDPDGDAAAYLRAAADGHVFNVDKNLSELLGSVQSPQSALRMAIDFEKDTIVFFSALKDAVNADNRDKVELLIQEELRHVRILQDELARL